MNSFVHTPDGVININDNYKFSLDLFKKLEPEYSLPEGMISRIYIQGKNNILSTGFTQVKQPPVWEEGDRYIGRLSELLYLEQHEAIKDKERKEYVDRIKKGAN